MFSVIYVVSMPISFFHNRFNIVAKLLCIVQVRHGCSNIDYIVSCVFMFILFITTYSMCN